MVSVCTIIGKEREATRPGVTEVRVNQREREREEREREGGGGETGDRPVEGWILRTERET